MWWLRLTIRSCHLFLDLRKTFAVILDNLLNRINRLEREVVRLRTIDCVRNSSSNDGRKPFDGSAIEATISQDKDLSMVTLLIVLRSSVDLFTDFFLYPAFTSKYQELRLSSNAGKCVVCQTILQAAVIEFMQTGLLKGTCVLKTWWNCILASLSSMIYVFGSK